MKIKTILFLMVLLIILFLTVGLLRANDPDRQVKEFIVVFDEFTNIIVEKIGDPPTLEGIKETQVILDTSKADLRARFEALNPPGGLQVNPLTATKLDDCLGNNSRKINDLQVKYLQKVEADMTALNNAVAGYFEKKSRKNLNEMKNKLTQLNKDKQLLEEIKKAAGSYKSILE